MPLYEELQKPPVKKVVTPLAFDPAKHHGLEETLDATWQELRSACYRAHSEGKRSVVGYMSLTDNKVRPGKPADYLAGIDWSAKYAYYLRFHKPGSKRLTDDIIDLLTGTKKEKVDLRGCRENIIGSAVGGNTGESSRGMRDYTILYLRKKLMEEHFPANGVTPIDFVPVVPEKFNSWTAKAEGSIQAEKRYLIGINIHW